jgi:DNA-binding CsgD family transcriptional regulator
MTLAAVLFALIAFLIAFDVVSDYRAGTDALHLVTEGLVMALALCGVLALWRQLRSTSRAAMQLRIDLEAARLEAQRFRSEARDALRGLGEAIDRQFGRWHLTPAEREVGLLLLKGLSHKEIAQARSTSETTIRQQALVIYRKAGLRNRSELSAFFLEDLLLPVEQR